MTTPTLIPLTHLGLLKVSGADAATFLQGQLSADIRILTPGTHQLSALCNRMGRVLALMDIFYLNENDYFLVLPLEIIHGIQQNLQKYIVFSKAKIEDVSADYAGFALMNIEPLALPSDLTYFRSTADASLQIWGPRALIDDYAHTHVLGPLDDFLLAQMRAKVPLISTAQSAEFLPHPLGLVTLGAISFKKGCFVGQEIIARMQYRTQVKKHLQYFELPSTQQLPQEKFEIENRTGVIVNALAINNERTAVLGIVEDV